MLSPRTRIPHGTGRESGLEQTSRKTTQARSLSTNFKSDQTHIQPHSGRGHGQKGTEKGTEGTRGGQVEEVGAGRSHGCRQGPSCSVGGVRRCLQNYLNDHMKQPRQGPKSARDSVLRIQDPEA